MNVVKGNLKEDSDRDLFWTRIAFMSDDSSQRMHVFICASGEYLRTTYSLSGNQQISQEQTDEWQNSVIAKWLKSGSALFKQDTHYDVYANTPEGEANGIDFLLTKTS